MKVTNRKEEEDMKENYIQHYNTWWWGKTITLIHNKGWASIQIQFDNDYPGIAFIKGLTVFEYERKKGIGTALLLLSEEIAKSHGKRFTQLSADVSNEWLVKWYEKNGYVITYKDEHEYTMLKVLGNPTTKESGYEWGEEDKKLKKIEQNPAWSEDDKDLMYNTLSNLTELKDRYGDGYGNVGKCIDWLKSLKDRLLEKLIK